VTPEPTPSTCASGEAGAASRPLAGGFEDGLLLALFWALLIAVFLQFFTRYALNDSIAWTEEVARYLLVLLGFVGSIRACRRGSHIAVEALVDALPPGPRRLVQRLTAVLAIFLLLWGAWLASEVMQLVRFQRLASVDVPLNWLYAIVALAFALMAARTAQRLVRDLRGPPAR
jgi:TRAP-type C4-dicarboxylate transport system permease small subunit